MVSLPGIVVARAVVGCIARGPFPGLVDLGWTCVRSVAMRRPVRWLIANLRRPVAGRWLVARSRTVVVVATGPVSGGGGRLGGRLVGTATVILLCGGVIATSGAAVAGFNYWSRQYGYES